MFSRVSDCFLSEHIIINLAIILGNKLYSTGVGEKNSQFILKFCTIIGLDAMKTSWERSWKIQPLARGFPFSKVCIVSRQALVEAAKEFFKVGEAIEIPTSYKAIKIPFISQSH